MACRPDLVVTVVMFDFVCLNFVLDSFEFVGVVVVAGCRVWMPYFVLVVLIVVVMAGVVVVAGESIQRQLVVVACKFVFDSVVVIADFVVDFGSIVDSRQVLVVDLVPVVDSQG